MGGVGRDLQGPGEPQAHLVGVQEIAPEVDVVEKAAVGVPPLAVETDELPAPPPPERDADRLKFAADEGFQRELRRKIDAYFASTGKRRRDCPRMYLKTALILAWAVGSYFDPRRSDERTLLERWDGTQWSIVATPELGSGDSQFAAVGPQRRFIRLIAFVPADRVDETRAAIAAIAQSIALRP